MTGPASSHCRSIGDFLEPEMKTEEVSEYFSPDILHVFMDDDEGNKSSIFSKTQGNMPLRTSPSSFPQFQQLPMELRCLIWEAAVPEPTVVPRTWSNRKFRYNLHRKIPAVLQACSEARRLLVTQLERTHPSACPKYQLTQTRGRDDEGVYMDWQADSVWIYRGCELILPPLVRLVPDPCLQTISTRLKSPRMPPWRVW